MESVRLIATFAWFHFRGRGTIYIVELNYRCDKLSMIAPVKVKIYDI